MRGLTDLLKVAWRLNQTCPALCNAYTARRNLHFQVKVKWVRPVKEKFIHPVNSGDLVPMKYPNKDEIHFKFKDSQELATADDIVKKVFTYDYLAATEAFNLYEKELVEKVKSHEYDVDSDEVKVAKLTAKIRFYQSFVFTKSTRRIRQLRTALKEKIELRKKILKVMRLKDYKKFEWLLEKLDITYKPLAPEGSAQMTRKKSLTLLIKLIMMKKKEVKLAELKKELDEKKVPFLEEKLKKMKWIKEQEEKNGLEVTITDDDINECVDKLEKVKLEVAERQRLGYLRKIHPYYLEPYHETMLREKEIATSMKRP